MRKFAKGLAAGLMLAGSAVLAPATGAEMAGVAAGVSGTVQVAGLSDTVGRNVASGDEIFLGDTVSSDADSQMQLLLLDETVFTIGPNSELVIDEFVYDPETNSGTVAAKVLKGAFRFTTGLVGQKDPDSVSIGTPLGTIGIRGTIVAGVVSGDQALIVLVGPGDEGATKERAGRIEVSNSAGSVSISRSGYGTILSGDGSAPSTPVAVPLDTMNAILSSVGSERRPTRTASSAESDADSSGEQQAESDPQSNEGSQSGSLSASVGGSSIGNLAGLYADTGKDGSGDLTVVGPTDDTPGDSEIATSVSDRVTTVADLVSITTGTATLSGNGTLTGGAGSTGTFTFAGTLNFGNQTAQFTMDASWSGNNNGSLSINAGPESYSEIFKDGDRFSSFGDGDLEPFKDTDSDFTLNNATSATVDLRIRNVNGVVAGALDTKVEIIDGAETITGEATATR